MLVLKNSNHVLAEGGMPLVNNEVNALMIENTNTFSFGVITTGPIRVYWGNGSYADIGVKTSRFNVTKNYTSIGNYNITITGVENITELHFDYGNNNKINTSVIWFIQFINLILLNCRGAYFTGSVSQVINSYLKKLLKLTWSNNTKSIVNLNECTEFCNRALVICINNSFVANIAYCDLTTIFFNPDILYLELVSDKIVGKLDNIINTKFTSIGCLIIYNEQASNPISTSLDINTLLLPSTCKTFQIGGLECFPYDITSFNFVSLIKTNFAKLRTSNIDLTDNTSFRNALCYNLIEITFWALMAGRTIKLNLNDFVKASYINININCSDEGNLCTGDVGALISKTISQFWMVGGKLGTDGNYTTAGTIQKFSGNVLFLEKSNVILTADVFKTIASNSNLVGLRLNKLPNFTGDISNTVFTNNLAYWNGFGISEMPNLYCDITTLSFNSTQWVSSYGSATFNNNPKFTGNLANLTLWANKSVVNLSNCAYTNISGFVRKVFANRNACLKAAGGMTTILVQGNVDNNLLTGIEQQPPLGSYTGNINDLTEAQIDKLGAGNDYTGTGSSTPWTDKEKIWIMTKLKNSSADSSLRYRATISY